MEFDINKVYTALNADEVKPGSKVIVADDLVTLRQKVEVNNCPDILEKVKDKCNAYRFLVGGINSMLCYLVSEPYDYWTKLKIGDIIQNASEGRIAMVTAIDSFDTTRSHIFAGRWISDATLWQWKKVED